MIFVSPSVYLSATERLKMKRGTGSLMQRNNRFYVCIKIEGRTITRALLPPEGNPVTTLVDARRAQALAVRAFTLVDRKEALRSRRCTTP